MLHYYFFFSKHDTVQRCQNDNNPREQRDGFLPTMKCIVRFIIEQVAISPVSFSPTQPSLRMTRVSFSILNYSQGFYAELGFNMDYQITAMALMPPMQTSVKFHCGPLL